MKNKEIINNTLSVKDFYMKYPFPKLPVEDLRQVEHYSWILNCIPKHLRPNKENRPRILEIGCGTGNISLFLSQFGDVTGIDFSKESLKYARKNAELLNIPIQFIEIDITKEFLFEKFDYIFCIGVLHHIRDVDNAIKNIKRMMNKDTLLITSVYHKHFQNFRNIEKRVEERRKAGYSEEWIQDAFYHPYIRLHNRKEFIKDIKGWNLNIIGEWRKLPDWTRIVLNKGAMLNFCLRK